MTNNFLCAQIYQIHDFVRHVQPDQLTRLHSTP